MSGADVTGATLASTWQRAARLLGIEVVVPFGITLPYGSRIDAAVLVKDFGARNGMLILSDYAKVRNELSAIEKAGFGFSVLDGPREDEPFVLEEFVEILRDWGWSGPGEDAPAWLGVEPISNSADKPREQSEPQTRRDRDDDDCDP